MVCVFSYKTSMRNVTPCVSIVSCLKFVRLKAQFIRFYNPFVIVNAQKEAIMIHEKTFVRLNALCLSSKFTKVHLILQFTLYFSKVPGWVKLGFLQNFFKFLTCKICPLELSYCMSTLFACVMFWRNFYVKDTTECKIESCNLL